MTSLARPKRRGLLSALAMASAGLAAGSLVVSAPAAAQEQPSLSPSRAFDRVYQPIAAIANDAAGDHAAGKAALPGLIAAAQSPDERYLAGSVAYVLGTKLNERPLQQQGMELMLQSGKATPAATAELNFFLGDWAYEAQQWTRARTYFQAAVAAGYTTSNLDGLIAESFFKDSMAVEGLAFLKGRIEGYAAAGQQVPSGWALRGLQVALESGVPAQANEWSALLVGSSPSAENWSNALRVTIAANQLAGDAQLDVLRLMALTDALTRREEFERYILGVDARVAPNEAAKILADGERKGLFSAGDDFYDETARVVEARLDGEQEMANEYANEAAGAASGRPAANAGEAYLSLGQFARAEEMFRLAIDKGDQDRDAMLVRLGIAQVHQGKLAEAKSTFGQVSGTRAVVAQMWSIYADTRA